MESPRDAVPIRRLQTRGVGFLVLGLGIIVGITACGEDPVTVEMDPDLIVIDVMTEGAAFDADGYTLLSEGESIVSGVEPVDIVRISSDRSRSVDLELADVADNCIVEDSARRTVPASDEPTRTLSYRVTCSPPADLADLRLVFVIGNRTIHTMALDGARSRALTAAGPSFQPAVSSDGSWIAFVRDTQDASGASRYVIHQMTVDGSDVTPITEEGSYHSPSWSPDRGRLAYVEGEGNWGGQLQVRTLATGDVVEFSDVGGWPIGWGQPRWSPDGTRIAFTRLDSFPTGISTMAPDGSDVVGVTSRGFNPVWAPTSDKLVYRDEYAVHIVPATENAVGGELLRGDQDEWVPTDWSADGEWIALTRTVEGRPDLYVLRLTDRRLFRLTLDGRARSGVFLDGA